MVRKIHDLKEKVYGKKTNVEFPYLFEQDFLWDCINSIDSIEISRKKKFFLILSMFQDRLIFEGRKSRIFSLLQSVRPLRECINRVTSVVKEGRGDKKSEN
jgi:hypothetical protein